MNPQHPSRLAQWVHNAERMLVGIATVARSTLGGHRWESLIESTMEFLGLRTLTPTQAQALAARMNQELTGFVAACAEQRRALGGVRRLFNRGNSMLVVTSLEKLRAMTDQLDGVLTEYTRMSQPGNAAAQPVPGASVPGIPAAPPRLPNLSAGDTTTFAKHLRGVYAHAIIMAQHAQTSLNGSPATNTYAVTSAVAAIHLLVRWLHERTGDLRTQMHM